MEENGDELKLEESSLTEEEIIDTLSQKLNKKVSISSICDELNISEFELYGYFSKLQSEGFDVRITSNNGQDVAYISNSPDYSKDNVYEIKEDKNETTKIGVISDLRFGSKNEQIQILNDVYKKFHDNGVKYVIITGNLLEGKYNSSEEEMYGNTLISNDGYEQANHLIEYFPHVDGIQTLFVTGQTDHTFNKQLNIGKYIENNRSDMKYLGPKSCTLKFNNVSIKIENLKKQGEQYTIAYPPQKYLRSLPSYEDYDAILLGGTLTAQDFPQMRDTRLFTVPSLVSRTKKMENASQQNMMGAWELGIEYDRKGNLKRLTSELSPYYKPVDKTYLTTKPLFITNETKNDKISLRDENSLIERLNKIYHYIKKEESFSSLKERLSMTDNELFGVIFKLQQIGREISIEEVNGELIVRKHRQLQKDEIVKPSKEELHKAEFGIVSDTHYGSIYSQPSMVNTFCYEAYNRGINRMIHVGDISDGDYHTKRPVHVSEVFLYGATAQVNYVAETLPKYPGMTWEGICGSHDQSHTFNYGPFNFGEELERLRPDFTYLGQDRGYINIDNCIIEVFHPGGGTSRILSTKPQNGIDGIPSGHKPNIQLRGHYHKQYAMLYRNIHSILCPCNVDQSSFMMKNDIPNMMGDIFLTIWYDDEGHIQYINQEPMIFTQDDVRKNDWENPTKYMKNKILTKRK